MAQKGFIRTNEQAEVLQREIEALKDAGVPVQDIWIGTSTVSLPEEMEAGDPTLAPFREGRKLYVTINGKRCAITPPTEKTGRQVFRNGQGNRE